MKATQTVEGINLTESRYVEGFFTADKLFVGFDVPCLDADVEGDGNWVSFIHLVPETYERMYNYNMEESGHPGRWIYVGDGYASEMDRPNGFTSLAAAVKYWKKNYAS